MNKSQRLNDVLWSKTNDEWHEPKRRKKTQIIIIIITTPRQYSLKSRNCDRRYSISFDSALLALHLISGTCYSFLSSLALGSEPPPNEYLRVFCAFLFCSCTCVSMCYTMEFRNEWTFQLNITISYLSWSNLNTKLRRTIVRSRAFSFFFVLLLCKIFMADITL